MTVPISIDRFLGTISYVLAALSGMLIVGCRLPKKPHFALRVILAFLVTFFIRYTVVVYSVGKLSFQNQTQFILCISTANLLVVALCSLFLAFCYSANLWATLFCSTAGYSLQFIAHKLYKMIPLFFSEPSKGMETFLILLISALIYLPVWYFYFRRANHVGMYQKHKLQIGIAVVFVLFTIYINM
ncbi:MAG: hypothetical protein IJ865_00660, partial [Clostridia bacterium]|nr:hypothetical protein [Clostridia bacterium]